MQNMKLQTLLISIVLLGSVGVAGAGADDLTDPKEILRRSVEALRRTKSVRYAAEFTATGWVKQFVPEVKGKAIVGPTAEFDVPRFYTELELRSEGSEETLRFTSGCNGDKYFLIDPQTKKAYRDMDPGVMGPQSRNVQRLVLKEFGAKEPLQVELAAGEVTLTGQTQVGDETCYNIRAVIEGESHNAITWSISTRDFLPRKVVRTYPGRGENAGDGMTMITLTDLVINAGVTDTQFDLVLPEGYVEQDVY